MRYWYSCILFFIIILWPLSSYSQEICTVPLPPLLTLVSVEPETGKTEFKWDLSPSDNIAAYIIYSYRNGVGMPIDTLWDPSVTSYSYFSTATNYFSVSYVIAAHRLPNCTSPLSNALNTIFCSSELDTCNKKIILKWNNFPDYPNIVNGYKILVSENDSPMTEMYFQPGNSESFSISEFNTDSEYCFVIQADLENGFSSKSNKVCLSTRMERPPNWINADFATINNDQKVSLSFSVDPQSEIRHFMLERKTGPSGIFQEIDQLQSENNKIVYIDNQASVNIINYYRLSAINSCNYPITVSNLSSNIVLSVIKKDDNIKLIWNTYRNWTGNIEGHRLFGNTGNGFEEIAAIDSPDTTYTIYYKDIMYDITAGEVCFYLSTSEISNPHGINGLSSSSHVCASPTEIITVPNIFTPNSGTENAFFKPVFSFTPIDYLLVISDRQGNTLFETSDFYAKWDGSANGMPQPQGVFLWFLKVKTPSGNIISRTGTVTIINNR